MLSTSVTCKLVTLTVLKKVLKYKDELLPLLRRLRDKTFAKRGFSWSGKLLSSLLLTLTHTYPLEDKFVNPKEWHSNGACLRVMKNYGSHISSL